MSRFIRIAALAVAGAISACGGGSDNESRNDRTPTGSVAAQGELTAAESAAIVFLREEEKLARDVYRALTPLDGQVFTNIASSEQSHMDAVAVLLARYGVPDPAAGHADGVFTDTELQAMYTALVAAGSASPVEAWKVGAEIEELDLRDLARMRADVSHNDVLATIDQLARGSRNHLRAFYGKLAAAGVGYAPKYISEAELRAIVDSPTEKGGSGTQ